MYVDGVLVNCLVVAPKEDLVCLYHIRFEEFGLTWGCIGLGQMEI